MTWEKLILEQKAIPPFSDPGPSARTARAVLSCEQEGAAVGSRSDPGPSGAAVGSRSDPGPSGAALGSRSYFTPSLKHSLGCKTHDALPTGQFWILLVNKT